MSPRKGKREILEMDDDLMSKNEEQHGNHVLWDHSLPQDVWENVLLWLPLESICRFSLVSKEWKALMSSTTFFRRYSETRNKHPWILVNHDSGHHWLRYDYYSRTWKILNFSWLSCFDGVRFEDSHRGIILFCLSESSHISRVCNPLKAGTSFKLPRMLSANEWHFYIYAWGILVVDDNKGYKVVQAGANRYGVNVGNGTIEIYDSSMGTWRIVARLRDCFFYGPVVFNNNFFFLMSYEPMLGVRIYNTQDYATMHFVLLPVRYGRDHFPHYRPRLVVSEERVLLATPIVDGDHLKDIIVFELELEFGRRRGNVWSWKEIARMPHAMCQCISVRKRIFLFSCTTVGEFLCFRKVFSRNILILCFHLKQGSWLWLPEYINTTNICYNGDIAFEPRMI
ncbi:hypothetical protein KI387_041573 [Taxus chinensis]|uniref:F-box domain-containing protein n=1 Tax=Taxus chinensis TaxID=29808 RepID=A0AA38C9P1_TAXCH|nr:hypothetical protein KI387_041573 [Taxus chinensis]